VRIGDLNEVRVCVCVSSDRIHEAGKDATTINQASPINSCRSAIAIASRPPSLSLSLSLSLPMFLFLPSLLAKSESERDDTAAAASSQRQRGCFVAQKYFD